MLLINIPRNRHEDFVSRLSNSNFKRKKERRKKNQNKREKRKYIFFIETER